MMKRNKRLARLIALVLALLLLLTLIVPAFAVGGGDTITIRNADDLLTLSRNCTLDTWSRGKTVMLQADISLDGVDFTPIPTFGGTFDGRGHTISGLTITGSTAPAGLFGILQESAVVKDLTVSGNVVPAGDADTIGGIAGLNYGKLTGCAFQGFVSGSSRVGGVVGLNETTGQLINCSFQGAVTGEHYVGGIAGWNAGSLIQCSNSGSINTTVINVKAQFSGLDLQQLRSTESVPAGTDIGGIAGFSTGLLQSCKNTGSVGYEHMGYNVGGIVGRQSGYLDGCVNSGTVRGRKDVGGIAGQLEPQVILKYNEGTLSSLWDELDVLEDLMDRALSDAENASDAISGSMSDLTASVGTAKDTAVDLTDAMTEWANGNIDQINDASARLSWVLDQMGPILDDLGDALEQAEIASGQFSDALDDAELAAEWGDKAVAALEDALTDLQNASGHGSDAYIHVENAMAHLENSLGDTDKTKAALKELADAAADMASAFSGIAGAMSGIGDALDEVYQAAQEDPNWQDLRSGVDDLRSALVEISGALARVSDALETLRQVIDDPENEPTNRELLQGVMDALSTTTGHLEDAYQAFSDALDAYENGDIYGDDGAVDKLGEGMDALNEANSEIQHAQENISQIIENVESDPRTGPTLEQLANGLADLNAGLGHANAAIVQIDTALRALEDDPRFEETTDRIYGYLRTANDALETLSDASGRISRAIKDLEGSLNPDQADAAWDEIKDAGDDLELAADDLDRAVVNLKLALDYLEKAGEYGSDAMSDLNKASETMGKAISLLRKATEQTADVIGELAEKPAIQFTPISSDLTERGDALDDALSQMLDRVNALNDTMSASSDILLADLRAINRQVGVIIDLLRQASEEAKEEDASDRYEDVSDREQPDDQTSGRISASRNDGTVEGDINVAGIVGSIAIEYDFDPEDDLTKDGSRSLDYRYQTAAVVWDSVNEGTVTAKKDYAGGIVGRMDLGTVSACRGYGRVESTGGDYVGGIAGLTSGTIRGCFAKCILEGDRYVGGIVGSGTAETAGGSASTVSGCYSMVSIPRYEQYFGAVSGADAGTFLGNCFVSDTLAGINGASYSGRAEPIAYADLPWDDAAIAIPDAFRHLTLDFVVDGEIVKAVIFDYGQSFGGDVYPELPEKEGYYAYWDVTELQELHFDTVVTAVYERHISALSSAESRSSDRPVFFLEGQFDEDAVLTVAALENTPSDFDALPTDYKDFAAKCFSGPRVSRSIVEQWSITVPEDGLDTHTVRYLPPDENPDHLDIYVKENGTWNKVETQAVGSYLAFQVSGPQAEIAVLSTLSVWWIWLLAAALLVLLLALILRLTRRGRKRKKVSSPPPAEPEDGPANGESELTLSAPPGMRVPPPPPPPDAKRKRKRWPLLLAVLVLAGAVAGIALSPLGPKLKNNLEASVLLRQYVRQQELSMDLSVRGELDGQAAELSARVDRTQAEGRRVTCISQGDVKLYYADGVIFLENGKAYQLSGDFPDYSRLLELALPLYQRADISSSKGDGTTTYTVTAGQEDARALLAVLLPSAADLLSGTDTVTAELAAEGGEVSELRFSSGGTLNDSGQTPFSVSAVLRLQRREPAGIPDSVRAAVCGGDYEATGVLTGDLLRLASAWEELNGRDPLSAKLLLRADCGSLALSDDLELYRWTQDDLQINCIRKGGRALYFTDTAICGADGESVPAADEATVEAARLLEIAYRVCMNADLDCGVSGAAYTYAISLDEKGMEDVIHTIAPDTQEMDLLIDAGTLRVVVRDNIVQSIRFSCTGSAQVLLSNVTAVFTAELRFPDEAVDLTAPDAVRQALA